MCRHRVRYGKGRCMNILSPNVNTFSFVPCSGLYHKHQQSHIHLSDTLNLDVQEEKKSAGSFRPLLLPPPLVYTTHSTLRLIITIQRISASRKINTQHSVNTSVTNVVPSLHRTSSRSSQPHLAPSLTPIHASSNRGSSPTPEQHTIHTAARPRLHHAAYPHRNPATRNKT